MQSKINTNVSIIRELVKTEFKLRYQRSILGYAWSLLRPMTSFAILYIVFTTVFPLGKEIEKYPIYLLSGIVLWTFFTEATTVSMGSIVARGDLIRKVSIPKYTIIIASILAAMVNLFFNTMVLIVLIVINKVSIGFNILLIPLYLTPLMLFTSGLALLLSAIYVRYRDIGHMWEVGIQALFYLTPIIYPLSRIANPKYQFILSISPIAYSIQNIRELSITKMTITASEISPVWGSMLPWIISILFFLFSIWFFKKRSKYFAEEV